MKSIYIHTLIRKCTTWLLSVVLLGVVVSGCKKDQHLTVAKGEPVYVSLSSKILNTDVAGKQIHSVRIILINSATNHIVAINEFVSSPIDPLVIPVVTGKYDVYVVANEEADGSENTALSNVHNLPTLRAVNLKYSIDINQTNVPMFAEIKNVLITAPTTGEASPNNLASVSVDGINHGTSLPVELERMVSKVSIKIVSKHKTLTSARIKNIPNIIPLFDDNLLSTYARLIHDISPSLFVLTESVDESKQNLDCNDVIIPSLKFAIETDKDNAMLLEFSTSTGDTYVTPLGHLISGPILDYRIKRNHNYEITVRLIEKTIITTITLKPWTSIDENLDII